MYANKMHDDGAKGKAFEMLLKEYFKVNVKVAAKGRTDLVKWIDGKRSTIEIKTAAGELADLDENGNIVTFIGKNDYIIYRATETSHAYIMNAMDFWTMVTENGLTRQKFTKAMNDRKKAGLNWYYDRITLKTIDDKTSHRQRDKINALLEQNATRLDEFVASHEIITR